MPFSQAQLDALEAAITEGARTVEWSDGANTRRVGYHSLDEMIRLRNLIKLELAPPSGGGGRKVTTSSFDNGL